MSSDEVRLVYFGAVDGKTSDERRLLREAYKLVISKIFDREFAEAEQGMIF
jgi:hypothetical protein